ncbi:MAG: putative membrane protein [Crocinitomicaceae bacterium]|jgi:uncharacterized membrane protein
MLTTTPKKLVNLHPVIQSIAFGFYTISSFVCALFISWVLMASVDFAYPMLHDSMNITQHVEKYGPQNHYRNNFENTDRIERIRLFTAINDSIHSQGHGLDKIEYYDKTTLKRIDTLLHRSEIIHLKDVAALIDAFRFTALAGLIIWVGLILLLYKKNIPPPNLKQQTLSTLAIVIFSALLILVIGPVTVFYAFHEWLFPANHKWFFYYQESLMTILMKAPFLFGYIAILITLLTIPVFIVMNMLAVKLLDNSNKI